MNLRDLIDQCRNETRDTSVPYLWSDPEWTGYLNEAADEACIRARLIENEGLELDSSAGDPYADIPDYVWSIQRVTFNGRKLILCDKQMLDDTEGLEWESRTADIPVACYEVGGKLRFYPIPAVAGEVFAHAFCTPSSQMEDDEDEPQEIKPRRQGRNNDWALRCAYSKKDADTFDGKQAEGYEVAFEKTFGPRPDEKAMRRLRINVRRHVKGAYF